MFDITRFATEILLLIADNVSPERSAKSSSSDLDWEYGPHRPHPDWRGRLKTADLAALSLVSKRMRAIATPYLFELIQPPTSFECSEASSSPPVEELRQVLAGQPFVKHAKIFRLARDYVLSKEVARYDTKMAVEVLRACQRLTKLLDFPMGCLDNPVFIQEVNAHRLLATVNVSLLDLYELSASPPQGVIGALPTAALLRKFQCSLYDAPLSLRKAFFEAVLLHGIQIKHAYIQDGIARGNIDWIHEPHFGGIEQLELSIADDANFAARFISARRGHRSVSRIVFRNMDLSMVYRICGREVPSFISSGPSKIGSVAHLVCPVSGSDRRMIRCHTLSMGEITDDLLETTPLATILDSLNTAFPSLRDLELYFSTWVPLLELDETLTAAFSGFKTLKYLTLTFDIPTAEIDWNEIEDVMLSLAKAIPSLLIIIVTPDISGQRVVKLKLAGGFDVDKTFKKTERYQDYFDY